jgi:hypothetical protein
VLEEEAAVLPTDGITTKHVKTGEDVPVSTRVVAIFLLMTMADFNEHFFWLSGCTI